MGLSAAAVTRREKKEIEKKKKEEKKAAHRRAIEKKRLQKKDKMEKEKKKKEDKKKEVHYYIFYISLWPSFLLPSQEPKKVKAEVMKKEEDPESILMNLISMPSGSSLTFLIFSSSIQRERVRRRRRLRAGQGCGLAAGAACCGVGWASELQCCVGGDGLSKVLTIIPALYFYPVFYPYSLGVRVCVFVCSLKWA